MSDRKRVQHYIVKGQYRAKDDISILFRPYDGPDLKEIEVLQKLVCAYNTPDVYSRAHPSKTAFKKDYKKFRMYEAVFNMSVVSELQWMRDGGAAYFLYKPTGDRKYRARVILNPYVEVPNDPSSKATDDASLNSIDPSDATSGQDSSIVTKPPTTADQIEQPPTTDNWVITTRVFDPAER